MNGGLVLQKRLGLGELGLALEWLSLGPVLQKRWRQRRLLAFGCWFFGFQRGIGRERRSEKRKKKEEMRMGWNGPDRAQ